MGLCPEPPERKCERMNAQSAILLISDDTGRTGASRPLMLQRIMGTPLLCWLTASLQGHGLRRCLLVCPERWLETAKSCLPADLDAIAVTEPSADLLSAFLAEEDGEVLIITGPAVYIPGNAILTEEDLTDAPTGVCTVSADYLTASLDESFSIEAFLREHGDVCTEEDGFFAVTSADELADWQPILNRLFLYGLAANGVEIWDYDNCYIDPTVRIGAGTEILPGTILRKGTVIGENCTIGPNALLEQAVIGNGVTVNASQIYESSVGDKTTVGPFAYLRPHCRIGSDVKLGDFVEVKNSVVGDGTKVSHLTYIGDSDVGKRINFGCGTVTVNYDRAKKHRTTIEDDAFIGCNTNLIAPVTVGEGAYIAAGSTITNDVPANALSIARARQINKDDWASRNKIKEKK